MQPTPQLTPKDWISFLTGEILATSLLGKTLYSYPDHNWLQSLADEGIFAKSPLGNQQPDVQLGLKLLQRWMDTARDAMTAEAFDDLRVDYTRLFLGPDTVLAAPWESVYFSDERLLFQEQTLQVRAWYQRFGLEARLLYQEPDDHIGLELAFVAHLAQQALAALNRQEQVTFESTVTAQREFLSTHLLTWVPLWCDLIQSHANTDFFRGIALLTKGILAEVVSVLHVDATTVITM